MKYLYNGIELPALPEWDKTVYPYAYIWTLPSLYPNVPPTIYKLDILKSPIRYGTVDGKLSMYIEAQTSAMYNCLKTDGEFKAWEYYGETVVSKTVTVEPIWTNHDVISDIDGSVFFAASTPVPVNPLDPTALLMGWLAGKRMAAMRKSGNETPDTPTGVYDDEFPIEWTMLDVADNVMVDASALGLGSLVKISNLTPSVDELAATYIQGTKEYVGSDITLTLNYYGSETLVEGVTVSMYEIAGFEDKVKVYVVEKAMEIFGVTIPEPGMYITYDGADTTGRYSIVRKPVAYLYNGVRLRDINAVWTDKTAYPYAVIYQVDVGLPNYYYLIIASVHSVFDGSRIAYVSDGHAKYYQILCSSAELDELAAAEGATAEEFATMLGVTLDTFCLANEIDVSEGGYFPHTPIWSSYDILNTDGTTYLAASEPIPVYE